MRPDTGYLYAIKAEGTNYVKIGCTAGAVETRRKTLQTGQPFPLTILAAIRIEGDLAGLERQMHTALAAQRHHGEWFELALDAGTFLQLVEEARQAPRPTREKPDWTLTVRLEFPHWMVEAIDSHLHAMHSTTPMVTLSRSDAVRDLVFRALHTQTATDATPDTTRRPGRPVGRAPRASKGVGDAA